MEEIYDAILKNKDNALEKIDIDDKKPYERDMTES